KHKLVRPRLEMAGQADLMQLRPPIVVVLRIYTNAEGNVEKVDIVKSSGSINIDQPTRLAAYRWWFEPPVDSSGKPMPDVFEFLCRFI
ncbi:MAG: energy transducer TonB, partial [Phycisphaerae bacterium]|nr:energy transducer TonB [Phycisphaerae bacterium]MDW8261137.1 energy transducer TonB [Phycisphaerales bacterium]